MKVTTPAVTKSLPAGNAHAWPAPVRGTIVLSSKSTRVEEMKGGADLFLPGDNPQAGTGFTT